MVTEFPFEIPAEYEFTPAEGPRYRGICYLKAACRQSSTAYSAPVTGGNFIDLVQRGFYDGMEFIRAEDNYVLQTGDPAPMAPKTGFIDPKTKAISRHSPRNFGEGDEAPIYGATLESLGLT
jgi:peptidylprolyl isomerase